MTKSAKWFLGILAFLAVIAAGFTFLMISLFTGSERTTEVVRSGGDKIALVEVDGIIVDSEDIVRQLKEHRENSSIKAILIRIESPGGGVVASQEIYEEVRKTRDSGKPVVASMGSVAASGGYYVACGASRLVANPGTLTGSIGVISEFLQLEDALTKLGVGVKVIKSGRLKDAGSPARAMTEDDEKYFQELIDDIHRQFVDVVERERSLEHEQAVELADGRVFTGIQAVELGLIDTIGTYEDAVQITADLAGIEGDPAIVKERKRRNVIDRWFGDVTESLSSLKSELLNRPILSYKFVGP
ncbi:MAG: signal peptide peptidase SppA [Bacteroidota bacterium]